ncbi:UNVERIFIED_CONTAM: hypothetical protein GTU68_064860 [Idotea baltica]|nr:hypothetical protein [Idotea baltica]
MKERVIILDFGSQYTQLIARRVREQNVYCEIFPYTKVPHLEESIKAVILSGSPCSVTDVDAPRVDFDPFIGKLPVLGVCYGAQLLADQFGGKVERSETREYGKAKLAEIRVDDILMSDIPSGSQVWMSHGDTIKHLPAPFELIAGTDSIRTAAFRSKAETGKAPIYGLQFHPEVTHSTDGAQLLRNFLFKVAKCKAEWSPSSFVDDSVSRLKHAIGDVFQAEAAKLKNIKWLGQGTIYPDVIESVSVHGPSVTIKSHHNVGGLPDTLNLKVVEPLNMLFKDEVRKVGAEIGVPAHILNRHPFPGPGLGIRILGDITPDKVALLQEADYIFTQNLKSSGYYDKIWQAGAILLPIHSVGVMGDERTYEQVIALRAVNSRDGMTAEWSDIPHELLSKISSQIINEVKGINRVVYDISTKPPATIEWE